MVDILSTGQREQSIKSTKWQWLHTNAGPLKALIEQFELCINNEPEVATRPKSTPEISIIDLSLTTQDLGPLPCWLVDQDYLTGSDHELILMEWEDLEKTSPGQPSSEVTGWHIQGLLEDAEALNKAVQAWQALAEHQRLLSDTCVEADVAEKAIWIQESLTQAWKAGLQTEHQLKQAQNNFTTPVLRGPQR
ncbi:hypothetical protein VTN00DRAFT_4828 [Thermoascus crustaceus]|uniref:uncharacterized protein n=1 Tax=Thermoascus crustaceus TaxID=5088 RepID=UPI003742B87C